MDCFHPCMTIHDIQITITMMIPTTIPVWSSTCSVMWWRVQITCQHLEWSFVTKPMRMISLTTHGSCIFQNVASSSQTNDQSDQRQAGMLKGYATSSGDSCWDPLTQLFVRSMIMTCITMNLFLVFYPILGIGGHQQDVIRAHGWGCQAAMVWEK